MDSITRTGIRDTEFLLSVANSERSFEKVTLLSGQGILSAGTLLTAGNAKAVDGVDAAKVLYANVDTGENPTDEDVDATVVARDAEVHGELLGWEDDTTDQEKLDAAADLLSNANIVVRWTTTPTP